jgi:hypothetical protein
MSKPNRNIAPYFDDFNESKKFNKILFRPGRAVQARELTQMSTILQNQIEKSSSFFLKQGDFLEPGEVSFTNDANYVKLESTNFAGSVNTSANAVFTGSTTGVIGRVVTTSDATTVNPYTMFMQYMNSGNYVKLTMESGGDYDITAGTELEGDSSTANGSLVSWDSTTNVLILKRDRGNDIQFTSGEDIVGGTTDVAIATVTDYNKIQTSYVAGETLVSGDSSAVIKSLDEPVGKASLAFIDSGIYFIDGFFANVDAQTLVLDAYSNTPSYRIGLEVNHEIITWEDDSSLLDNAQGSSNYLAPGADRNKTTLTLAKKSLADPTDADNFVELLRTRGGLVEKQVQFSEAPVLEHTLARRTFDESGSYAVRPFDINIRENLSTETDVHGNPGVYSADDGGSADQMSVVLDPGKAYVRGFEYETTSSTYIDIDKAREVHDETEQLSQNNELGNYILANGVYQLPHINTGEFNVQSFPIIDLVSDGINTFAGMNFTLARVNSATRVTLSDKMKGSGENAYTGGIITIGGPVQKESAIISKYYDANNVCDLSGTGFSDASNSSSYELIGPKATKAEYKIGTARVRDVVLDSTYSGNAHGLDGIYRIYLFDIKMNKGKDFSLVRSFGMRTSGGESTKFRGNVLTELTIEKFNGKNFSKWNWAAGTRGQNDAKVRTFKWVKAIKADGTGNIVAGHATDWNRETKKLLVRNLTSAGRDEMNPLLATQYASNLDVGDKVYEMHFNDGWEWVESGPYGEVSSKKKFWKTENKSLLYSLPQKAIKNLDNVALSHIRRVFTGTLAGGSVTFTLAEANEYFVDFNNTNYVISINGKFGDHGIRDDITSSEVTVDPGQKSITVTPPGGKSGDVVTLFATLRKSPATRKAKSLVGPVTEDLLNRADVQNDIIRLGKSDIYSIVSVYMSKWGDFGDSAYNTQAQMDVTDRFDLDTGQRDNFYDHGSLRLKAGERRPRRPLRVSYKYFDHSAGDYFSVESYPLSQITYGEIPKYVSPSTGKEYRLADSFDFRPSVDSSRGFLSSLGADVVELPCVGSSTTTDGYQYYLNRIDKLYLDSKGNFRVLKGSAAVEPAIPNDPDDGMVLYILNVEAYTFDTNGVIPTFVDNRRYTMRDIGKLEKRIERLEYYTTLNLLEKETADLTINDPLGFERFKNGFVVDTFTGHGVGDVLNDDYACSIDAVRGEMRPQVSEKCASLSLDTNLTVGTDGSDYETTGDLITLPYTETSLVNNLLGNTWRPINSKSVHKFRGVVSLDPPNDFWKATEYRPSILTNTEADYDSLRNAKEEDSYMFGSLWDEWRQSWFGVPLKEVNTDRQKIDSRWNEGSREIKPITETGVTTGVSTQTTTNLLTKVIGNRVISVAFVPFMRKRNITFTGRGLKANTRVYPFFERANVTSQVIPSGGVAGDPVFTDALGNVTGTFAYNPKTADIKFKAGMNTFKLTDSSTNLDSGATTLAENHYFVSGILPTQEGNIISTRPAEIASEQSVRNVAGIVADDQGDWLNPLAQTFVVNQANGAFATKVDLYFRNQPKWNGVWHPVFVEIREVENGKPGKRILPFARAYAYNTTDVVDTWIPSDDPTTFTFEAPVFLQEGIEYALVVKATSPEYNLWTAEIGKPGFITSDQVIAKQPFVGTFYGSENTLEGNNGQQNVMLKFNLHRAVFDTTKTPELIFSNDALTPEDLGSQPFFTTQDSTKIRVIHKNHGFYENDQVTIDGVETIQNGLPASLFNSTFTAIDVDLDGYIIDLGGAQTAHTTGYANSVSTSSYANATGQMRMDLGYVFAEQVIPAYTNNYWSIKPYLMSSSKTVPTTYDNIIINSNVPFVNPKVIANPTNSKATEVNYKSFHAKVRMESGLPNLSPVIDTKRIGVVAVSNRINKEVASAPTYSLDTETKTTDTPGTPSAANTISFKGDTTDIYDNVWFLSHVTLDADDCSEVTPTITGTLSRDTKLYQPNTASYGYIQEHYAANNFMRIYGVKGEFKKDYVIVAGGANNVANIDGGGVNGDGETIVVSFTPNNAPTAQLAWIANLGTEDFTERYNIGDRLNITSTGNVKNELIEARVERISSNNILTTYGIDSHAGEFQSAMQGESGETTITNVDGENRIYSVNTETQSLLSSIEPNKYVQVQGSSNNDGVYRVSSNDQYGNVVVDGTLTYEYHNANASVGTAVLLTQRDNFIADFAARGGSSKAVYVQRQCSLDSPADSLKVILSAEIPTDTSVAVFYKTLPANSDKSFDDIDYLGFNTSGTPDESKSYEKGVYKEFEYSAFNLDEFASFIIKVVLKSENTAIVPKIRDYRAIATSI